MERDRSPIDQDWIREYCDTFLRVANSLSLNNPIRASVALRIEYVQDLVEAWQKRNVPIDERERIA